EVHAAVVGDGAQGMESPRGDGIALRQSRPLSSYGWHVPLRTTITCPCAGEPGSSGAAAAKDGMTSGRGVKGPGSRQRRTARNSASSSVRPARSRARSDMATRWTRTSDRIHYYMRGGENKCSTNQDHILACRPLSWGT